MEALRPTVLALLWTVIAGASAQEPDFTEISFENLSTLQISSASKFLQSAREAPSAVEVVTREDIRRHGWRTLSEALSSLTGTYTANDRAYDFLGTRGFLVPGDYNTRFLLLIDGQRSNDNVYEQATFSEEFPVDLALVERIEYVPGPGSSIYGSNAIFGVINVITRRSEEMPPLQFATRLSDDGWREGRATLARRLDTGASLMFSATGGTRRGRDQTYADPDGMLVAAGGVPPASPTAHGLDGQRRGQFFARYEDGGFSLTGRYGERRVYPSSALYVTLFDDGGLMLEDTSASLLARYRRQATDSLGIEGRLEYAGITYDADYPYDDGSGNRYINRDTTRGRWWAGELRLLHTGFATHKVVAGVEAQHDTENVQRNADVGVAINPPIDVDSRRRRAGVYLQDEWTFADDWRLNAGARHDTFSGGQAATSPRLGLIWLASDATTLKLLAGRAYRIPNAYERNYANGVNYLANPDLEPESIRTVEAIWEQRFDTRQTLRVAVFDYRFQRLIAQHDIGGGQLQYRNQPRIDARGVEGAWRSNWASGAQLDASLAASRVEDEAGRRPGVSLRWIGKLRGSVPLDERWLLSAEARAQSAAEYVWNGSAQELPAQIVVDATLTSVRAAPGLDGHLRVRNLFDRRYDYPGSSEAPLPALPGQRRTWELSLLYGF